MCISTQRKREKKMNNAYLEQLAKIITEKAKEKGIDPLEFAESLRG